MRTWGEARGDLGAGMNFDKCLGWTMGYGVGEFSSLEGEGIKQFLMCLSKVDCYMKLKVPAGIKTFGCREFTMAKR